MSLLYAALLGIVQGLTEFLPISSTAHMTFLGHWLGLIDPAHPERWTAAMAVWQLGTLAAVLVYFHRDILAIVSAFFGDNLPRPRPWRAQRPASRLGWAIIVGTLPIVVLGLSLKKVIEGPLTKSLGFIAASMIVFALLLAVAEKTAAHRREMDSITLGDALAAGFGQACALIPGASRSGTTLTAALWCGLQRADAARFSFLLSIPAVLASAVLEFRAALAYLDRSLLLAYGVGIVCAFVSGWLAIAFLLRFLRRRSTMPFVIYRLLVGAALLVTIVLK